MLVSQSQHPDCRPGVDDWADSNWITGCSAQADIAIGQYSLSSQAFMGVYSMDEKMLGHSAFMR